MKKRTLSLCMLLLLLAGLTACGNSGTEETEAPEETETEVIVETESESEPEPTEEEEPLPTEEEVVEVIDYGEYVDSGLCGENLTWTLYESNGYTLVISGTGDMYSYSEGNSPWASFGYDEAINCVVLEEGVTSIGDSAFRNCDSLSSVTVSEGVAYIGEYAFYKCDNLSSVLFPSSEILIGFAAFDDCPNLMGLTLPENAQIESLDGICDFLDETWIEDEDGTMIASSENGDYDAIFAHGDGYYILYRIDEGFDAVTQTASLISQDGRVLLSGTSVFDEDHVSGLDTYSGTTQERISACRSGMNSYLTNDIYCGEGVFVLGTTATGFYPHGETIRNLLLNEAVTSGHVYYNCNTGTYFTLSLVSRYDLINDEGRYYQCSFSEENPYECVIASVDGETHLTIISSTGIVADLGAVEVMKIQVGKTNNGRTYTYKSTYPVGSYADGGYVYYQDEQLKFYDCSTGTSTVVCANSDRIEASFVPYYYLEDGEMTIQLTGTDGKTYTAVVDKQGNYIEEPHL